MISLDISFVPALLQFVLVLSVNYVWHDLKYYSMHLDISETSFWCFHLCLYLSRAYCLTWIILTLILLFLSKLFISFLPWVLLDIILVELCFIETLLVFSSQLFWLISLRIILSFDLNSELAKSPIVVRSLFDDDDDDDDDDGDDDDKFILWYSWTTKCVKSYLQLEPVWEILTIPNPWQDRTPGAGLEPA